MRVAFSPGDPRATGAARLPTALRAARPRGRAASSLGARPERAEIQPPARPTPLGLFLAFARLGLTAFGGPAMIAHIRAEVVEKRKWLDDETFRSGVALCQTVPGATAMQTSAYVGLRAGGAKGAAASFVGFGLPAFALMLALSVLYARFHEAPALLATFLTLDAFIVARFACAAYGFGRSCLKGWPNWGAAPIAAVSVSIGLGPILVVALSFALGALLRFRAKNAGSSAPGASGRFPLRPVIVIAAAAVCLLAPAFIDRRLFELALLMLRIDLVAFGDGIALGQITPGPIVIAATLVGWAVRGLSGSLVAAANSFLPSFLLVLIAAPFFARLSSYRVLRAGMCGVLGSFVGLLASTSVKPAVALPWDAARIAIAAASLAAFTQRSMRRRPPRARG